MFNLIGIVIFLPLIGFLGRQLGRRFLHTDASVLRHIRQSDLAVPEAAVENINRETLRLIDQSAALNQLGFGLPVTGSFYASDEDRAGVPVFSERADFSSAYAGIKQLEGEILAFALKLQAQPLEHDESERLSQVIPAIRNAVHAAKCLKDTHHDLRDFRDSADDRFNAWFGRFRDSVRQFYELVRSLDSADTPSHRFEILVALKNCNETLHDAAHADIYAEVALGQLTEIEISTLLNVNREIYSSNHSLLSALADGLLDMQGAADYESIPASH
jgi:phosphate:Na+ symporter